METQKLLAVKLFQLQESFLADVVGALLQVSFWT